MRVANARRPLAHEELALFLSDEGDEFLTRGMRSRAEARKLIDSALFTSCAKPCQRTKPAMWFSWRANQGTEFHE